MAGCINRATLIGYLGADPEIKTTQAGKKMAMLRLATTDSWRDKQTGERREATEWHRVIVFSEGLAGVVEKFTRKGSRLYIEGAIKTRKWQDQSGNDRYSTEIVIQGFGCNITLLDRAESGTNQGRGYDTEPSEAPAGPGEHDKHFAADLDDEVPF